MYEYKATVVKVVDGDTLHLMVDCGLDIRANITVRLSRVNTPELFGVKADSVEYEKGLASQKFVIDFMKSTNNNIRIATIKDKKEKYGRYLAEVYALEGPFAGKNLSDELLTHGFAVLYG